jgi:cytochrome c oxidase subunit II
MKADKRHPITKACPFGFRWPVAASLVAAFLLLTGCDGIQAALTPNSPGAERIAEIAWILFIGAAVIFVAVMALTLYAMIARPGRGGWIGSGALIIGGGLIFPVVTLSALLIYTLDAAGVMTAPAEGNPLRIEVIGHMWWWEVRYLDEDGNVAFVSANEVRVPVGRPVTAAVSTADVIHSFWVPNLAGKIDMIPGRVNDVTFQAEEPGTFRGQCAEYCGAQHAKMAFFVVAEEPERFARWFERQSGPAREPQAPFITRGRDLFLSSGCGACHTVRGTPAAGRIGPDLTHVGSRVSIAAGILDNHIGTLEAWIANSQRIKPENRMPSFDVFEGEDLRAIAAYLESLK